MKERAGCQIPNLVLKLSKINLTTDLKKRLDRASIVLFLKPMEICGGHLGETTLL